MSDGRPTLYSAALLAQARSPQHAGTLDDPSHVWRVDNPLCGDRVTLHLKVVDRQIVDVAHRTRGCALCMASASVMTTMVLDRSIHEARSRARGVVDALRPPAGAPLLLEDPALELFAGLEAAPGRTECVALPWVALLDGERSQ